MKKLLFTILLCLIATDAFPDVKYLRNVTGNLNDANSYSTTGSGGAADTTVADGNDDVICDSGWTGTISITAFQTINSLVCQTGASGTITHGAFNLIIDGQDASGDSLKLVSTITYTGSDTTTARFTFTGSGTSKITTAGKTLPNVTFNNSGDTFQLQDALAFNGINATNSFYLKAGTLDVNSQEVTASATSGAQYIEGAITFYTLNKTGGTNTSNELVLKSDISVTNSLNIDGNSSLNRVFVRSDTLGTPRTITLGASATFASVSSNLDMRDITMSGGAANERDAQASSTVGGLGDCGGLTGITPTTADDWYWNGSGTRNFSDYTYWYTATNGGGSQMASTRVPLPQDTCYIDGDSIDGATTIDQNMPRIPGIDFTGSAAMDFHLNNLAQEIYGSLISVDNVNFSTSTSYDVYFMGRGDHTWSLGSSDTMSDVVFSSIGGTYSLASNISSLNSFTLNNGTFDAVTYNISTNLEYDISASTTRVLYMGSGDWTCSGASNWVAGTTTGLTFYPETSTIYIGGGSGTTNTTFTGGGLSYNNLTTTDGTSTGSVTIVGDNTFNVLTVNNPRTLKLTGGSQQNVNSLVATGESGSPIYLDSTNATAASIVDLDGGTNTVYWTTIGTTGGVNVSGATWNALTSDNNTLTAGTGWTTAAAGGRRRMMVIQ